MHDRIEWYRTPINKQTLQELTRRNDGKAWLQALSFLGLYLASLGGNLFLFSRSLWLPLILGCYLHSIFVDFMGIGAAVHELSHTTAFRNKRANTFFYRLFAFLTWNSPVHFKESHNRHHQYTYYREFDYEQRSQPIPFTLLDLVSWFTFDYKKFFRYMRTTMAHAFGFTGVDLFFWDPLLEKGDPKARKMVSWARVLITGHLALILLFIYLKLWVLIYLISFSYFFATFFGRGTAITQHMGLRGDVPDWRVNSYTIDMGPVMRFLYWNMNYHTEHHMYAGVPFYNLPLLRKELAWDLQEPLPGLYAAWRRVIATARRQRREPEYRDTPNFPPLRPDPRPCNPASRDSLYIARGDSYILYLIRVLLVFRGGSRFLEKLLPAVQPKSTRPLRPKRSSCFAPATVWWRQ